MSRTSPPQNDPHSSQNEQNSKAASGEGRAVARVPSSPAYRCRDILENCLRVGGTIFEGIGEQELQQADNFLHPLSVAEGDTVYNQGDCGDALLYIVKGRVRVEADNTQVGEIGVGSMVGEMAPFLHRSRTASVTAVEDSELLLLQRKDFDSLRASGSILAWRLERAIVQSLSRRMRVMVDRIKEEMSADDDLNSTHDRPSLLERIKACLVSFPESPRDTGFHAEEVLRHSGLFEGEKDEVLAALGGLVEVDSYQPGSYLCRQGAGGDRIYFVADGQVAVRISLGATEGSLKVATVGPGGVLGLMDLVDHQGCSADCVAETMVSTFSLDHEIWQKLFNQDDKVGSAMRLAVIREFCTNLASANEYVGRHQ